MATTASPKLRPAELLGALRREGLLGLTAAARLLGIKASNFKRDAAPHLTEIPVEGSASVYLRSEVQRLARERKRRAAQSNGH